MLDMASQHVAAVHVPIVILGLAFALEAVNLVHVVGLVVAAVQEEAIGPQPLVCIKQQRNLRRPRAAVDKVAVEEVVVLLVGAAVKPEELHKIEVLACVASQSRSSVSHCNRPTVRVAADGQLDIVRDRHLHHGRLVVHDLLNRQKDLVDIFLVDLLAVLEPLGHVVDKLLCHLLLEPHAVVIRLYRDRVDIKALGRGGLVADLDGSVEGELADDLPALVELELGVLVVRVELDALFEVLDSVLGSDNRGVGKATAEPSLETKVSAHLGLECRVLVP